MQRPVKNRKTSKGTEKKQSETEGKVKGKGVQRRREEQQPQDAARRIKEMETEQAYPVRELETSGHSSQSCVSGGWDER